MIRCNWGQRGSPWEFNLRDIFRWCELFDCKSGLYVKWRYVELITHPKKEVNVIVSKLYSDLFGPLLV